MISVAGLSKSYASVAAISDVSFHLNRGELLTMLGPSGCGKTTTLRCIAGFIAPDAGWIAVNGKDILGLPPQKRDFGMVFQSYALFPNMTVFDNVAYGLKIRGLGKDDLVSRTERALDLVQLSKFRDRRPNQLSGGQQQRVALARAVSYEPSILLFDEPLSNLDAQLRIEMRNEIRKLQRRLGITAIYVTHDQEEALSISDQVMILRGGRVEQLATPWEIYHKPNSPFVASFVGAANVIPIVRNKSGIVLSPRTSIRDPQDREVEGAAWLVTRPDQIDIAEPGDIACTVVGSSLLGNSERIELQTEDGATLFIDRPSFNYPSVKPGERIGVLVNLAKANVLSRSSVDGSYPCDKA